MPSTKSDTGLPPRRTVRYIRADIANKINWQPHPIEPCYVEQERRISNKNFGIYIINQSGQGGGDREQQGDRCAPILRWAAT